MASLVEEARRLRANQLLPGLLDEYQRLQVDTLCSCPSDDLSGLQRASIAWQVIHDLRNFIDERTRRYADPAAGSDSDPWPGDPSAST